MGPSMKYVMLFLANLDPLPLSHFVTHPGTPTKKVRHTSRTPFPFFSRPITKNSDKNPLYKFSLNCSWGFFKGSLLFSLEGFVRGGFCPFPFCQNTSFTTESETSP